MGLKALDQYKKKVEENWTERQGVLTSQAEDWKTKKAEFDALAVDDPQKAVLHKELSEDRSALTAAGKSFMGESTSLSGDPISMAKNMSRASDFLNEFQGSLGDMGAEDATFETGSAEYKAETGKYEQLGYIEKQISRGVEGSQEQLDKSLEAIGTGAAGAEEAFTAGEKKMTDISTAGGEAITAAAREGGEGIAAAAGEGATAMKSAWQEGMDKAGTLLDPYVQAGTGALAKQQTLLGIGEGGSAGALEALESTPGYQFNLQQGLKGIQSGAAARGGTLGGRALQELQRTGAGIASQTYGTTLAQLGQVSGRGQQAATSLSGIGMQGAQGIAGAEQFGAAGAMAGAQFGAQGAMTGAQFGAQGAMGAAQFGAGGRAQTALSAGAAEASVYGQQASTVANLYSGQATTGTQIGMQATGQQIQGTWQRMEADLAREMASWQGGQSMFGDLLSIGGAVMGGPIGGKIADKLFD